jgi:ubiquinol-cytochrome c reductase cytochrome b subunit
VFRSLFDWFDHRTGYRRFKDAMLLEHIPGGARWRYVWGSALAFVFSLQLLTGILLMTAYSPSDSTAWGSVHYIQYQMDFGWLIRGLHHYGSQTMMVLIALHMLQVVIAGAHLPPREINWWTGLILLGITFGLSLTGYLLPWDQKGYWATRVATNIASKTPFLGEDLRQFLVGGTDYGNHTLTRFYAFHVALLPALLILMLIVHLTLFRRHGVTAPLHAKGEGWFWPDQAFRDLVVCLAVFGIMLSLAIFGGHGNPVTPPADEAPEGWFQELAKAGQKGWGANLDAPADRDTPDYPARPEWYFLFLFQLLKYFPGDQMLVGTFYIPNGVMLALILLPLFGIGPLRKIGHFLGILMVVSLLGAIAILTILSLAEDSPEPLLFGTVGNQGIYNSEGKLDDRDPVAKEINDKVRKAEHFVEQVEEAHRLAQRASQLAMDRIPVEGARLLMRNDPLTRGAKVFATQCGVCHRYTATEEEEALGIHSIPKEPNGTEVFKAADLGGFPSKEWIKGLLDNPGDPKYFGLTKLEGMKDWRKGIDRARERKRKKGEAEGKQYAAEEDAAFETIAGWLAQQALPKEKRDVALQEKGFELFMDNCSSCHSVVKDGEKHGSETAPDFTNYGSAQWLRLMIMSPGHKLRHGEANEMPAFRNLEGAAADVYKQEFEESSGGKAPVNHLSDVDRELIIRFMTHDYRPVFGGAPITMKKR